MITADGTRLPGPRRMLPENLHEYVDVQGDCWIWQGHRDAQGYGKVRFRNDSGRLAHRCVYQMLLGDIPDGLQLDHLCRNRACVNPDHLEPVTGRLNVRRSPLVVPTHCVQGHRLAGANVREYVGRPGRRTCVECKRAANLRYVHRVRNAS